MNWALLIALCGIGWWQTEADAWLPLLNIFIKIHGTAQLTLVRSLSIFPWKKLAYLLKFMNYNIAATVDSTDFMNIFDWLQFHVRRCCCCKMISNRRRLQSALLFCLEDETAAFFFFRHSCLFPHLFLPPYVLLCLLAYLLVRWATVKYGIRHVMVPFL